MIKCVTLVELGQALNRGPSSGVRGPFGASGLGGDELGVERVRQTRDDFVLDVEEIGPGLIEAFGLEMITGFGVNKLHIEPL